MKRRQLFEFTDLPGCPDGVRRLVTDYLEFVLRATRADAVMAPVLARVLRATGERRVVDLCSGAAGPLPGILSRLDAEGLAVTASLTDRFPDLRAFQRAAAAGGGRIAFLHEPVDATHVPANLLGVRTLFNSLHHFPPGPARSILADAAHKGAGVAVFEVTERTWRSVLCCLLLFPLLLVITPFIRPLTPWRLLLTYVVPVALFCIPWDALVSSLRSYRRDELLQMAASLPGPAYHWDSGTVAHFGYTITYLIGYPIRGSAPASRSPGPA